MGLLGSGRVHPTEEESAAKYQVEGALPTALVTSDPSGLVKPYGFQKVGLPFIDGILMPAGTMTTSIINTLNKLINFSENIRAFGASTKGAFVIEAEDNVSGSTKDLPRIKILNSKGELVATTDCDAGLKVVNAKSWDAINKTAKDVGFDRSPAKLLESVTEWLVFLNKAQQEKPDMTIGLNTEQPFPQLTVEDGYTTTAPWIKVWIKYSKVKDGCIGNFIGCAPDCLTYEDVEEEVGLDAIIAYARMRSQGPEIKEKAGEELDKLKDKVRSLEAKLKKAAKKKDGDKVSDLEHEVDAAKQQLQDNEAELKHLKKEGIPLKYAEHLNKDLTDNIQYKFAPGDPWKRTMSSMHGEKQWRKYSIGRIASRGKKRQKPKDNVIMTWVSGIEKAVENINLLLSHMRATFIKCVPFKIDIRGVFLELKQNLFDFVKSLSSKDLPSIKLITDMGLLMKGQNPVTGMKLVDGKGKDFGLASFESKMDGVMKFAFNLFFNLNHPLCLVNVFKSIAGTMSALMSESVKVVNRLQRLAFQCSSGMIIGRIQSEMMMLVSALSFKITKIPGIVVKNIMNFRTFPTFCRQVYGAAKHMISIMESFAHKDTPALTLVETGYNASLDEKVVIEDVQDSELGSEYNASKAASGSVPDIDVSAIEKEAAAADSKHQAEMAKTDDKDDKDDDAPAGNTMARN